MKHWRWVLFLVVSSPFIRDADAAQLVEVQHAAVGCVIAEQYPQLEARIEPAAEVARVRVFFHSDPASPWYFVEMKATDAGFRAALPKPKRSLLRFTYYVEATGTDFGTSRTPDATPQVVRRGSECHAGALVAEAAGVGSVLVGVPAGAVAVPPGFASSGVLAASGSGAGATAATGGGASTAVIVGGVIGAAAVGGVVAAVTHGGSNPSSVPSPSPAPVTILFPLDGCFGSTTPIRPGNVVQFEIGVGRWPTASEATGALVGQSASLSVDSVPLQPVSYDGVTLHTGGGLPDGYGNNARANWIASAGSHSVVGRWTEPTRGLTFSCPVSVSP